MLETEFNLSKNIYTIKDLREKALGSNNFQPKLITLDHQPVLYLPKDVQETAQNFLELTQRADKTAKYILDAYQFFRACVCFGDHSQVGVPLVFNGETYSWPKPANFDWGEMEVVHQHAQLSGEGAYDPGFSSQVEFVVEDLAKVGFINPIEWQEDSNRLILKPLKALQVESFDDNTQAFSAVAEILEELSSIRKDVSLGFYPKVGGTIRYRGY